METLKKITSNHKLIETTIRIYERNRDMLCMHDRNEMARRRPTESAGRCSGLGAESLAAVTTGC